MPQSGSGRGAGDETAVAEDGDDHFILADDGLVGDPLVRRFGIERPQAGAVGHDVQVRCGALPPVSQQKTISPGFHGLVCTCPIWKPTLTMNLISPVLRFMLRRPLGPAPMFRGPKSLLQRLPLGKLGGFRPANPEVHEVVIGIQAHVAIGGQGGRDGSADALVIGRGFHGAGGHVGEEFGEVDLENLPWSA
jgi:hypothetical protein